MAVRVQVRTLTRQMHRYITAARTLSQWGVTPESILLFPIRRRLWNRRNQIDLKRGVSITSPHDEPLLKMFEEIWVNHRYSPDILKIPRGNTIVDVGANVGVFTIWAAIHNPESTIIALEPSPRICGFLRRNVSVNRFHNVIILQVACGGKSGEAILYSRGQEVGNSLYCRDNRGNKFYALAKTDVLTLDEVFQRFNVRRCDLLKLDCEGAEYDLLFNAGAETLKRIATISMEYHVGLNDHTVNELEGFLESQGFEVERLPLLDAESGYLYASARS